MRKKNKLFIVREQVANCLDVGEVLNNIDGRVSSPVYNKLTVSIHTAVRWNGGIEFRNRMKEMGER